MPTGIEMDDDAYWDYDDREDCWNCGGEGFVPDCVTEYACMYPDEGCSVCMRRCDFCNPAPRNPEIDALFAQAIEARRGETAPQARSGTDESAVPKGCAIITPPHQPIGDCNG